MSNDPVKPSLVQELFDEFKDADRGEWGVLHIAMSDGNMGDSNLEFCFNCAVEEDDTCGALIAMYLLGCSMGRRMEIYERGGP